MTEKWEKGKDQLQLLLETVERIRRDRVSQLDATLVRELLEIHSDSGRTDAELSRLAEQAVERHLAKEGNHASA